MIGIYNPLMQDFTYEMLDDSNVSHSYTLRSMEITNLEDHIGKFMAKHLIDQIFNERGVKVNHELDEIEIKKEVFV